MILSLLQQTSNTFCAAALNQSSVRMDLPQVYFLFLSLECLQSHDVYFCLKIKLSPFLFIIFLWTLAFYVDFFWWHKFLNQIAGHNDCASFSSGSSRLLFKIILVCLKKRTLHASHSNSKSVHPHFWTLAHI